MGAGGDDRDTGDDRDYFSPKDDYKTPLDGSTDVGSPGIEPPYEESNRLGFHEAPEDGAIHEMLVSEVHEMMGGMHTFSIHSDAMGIADGRS